MVNASTTSNKAPWIAAGAVAVAAGAGWVALFSVPRLAPPVIARKTAAPAVKFADPSPANPLIREATAMRDLAPLFLPTERNATLEQLPRRMAGSLDVEPTKFTFPEAELRLDKELPLAATLNGRPLAAARPIDALAESIEASPILGFGRNEVEIAPLSGRGGFVEIAASATGAIVLGEALPIEVGAPTTKPWQPLQFIASVNAAGLVGPLILAERSGVEEVDQHYRNYLVQTFRIGERLAPGIYRVTIGP